MITTTLYILAFTVGFIVAKLTNPKDPVRDELLAHANAGSEVVYAVNGEACLIKKVNGKVVVYVGKLNLGDQDVSTPVGSGFDH